MTDLEITRLCAEASGFKLFYPFKNSPHIRWNLWSTRDTSDEEGALKLYDPLNDDAQAMALVKKFRIHIGHNEINKCWYVNKEFPWAAAFLDKSLFNLDINRAICECVAKMWLAKGEGAK